MLDDAMYYFKKGQSPIPLYSPSMFDKGERPTWYQDKLILALNKNAKSENPLPEEEIIQKLKIKTCKTPLIKWADFKQQRPTEKDVREWFNKWPFANIGLMTGFYHNLIVFDVDDQKALDYAKSKGGFPDTAVANSGKGSHYYFRCPEEYCNSRADKSLGLDIRGDGGYIVAPPSNHGSNREYQWQPDHSIFEVELAECSPWMLDLLAEYHDKKDSNTVNAAEPLSLDIGPIKPLNAADITELHLSDRIKDLILKGGLGKYPSRSEANQAVITALLGIKMDVNFIFSVFETFPIGEKYREHQDPEKYLAHSIDSGKKYLESEEHKRRDSLKITDCFVDDEQGNSRLDLTTFQEYVTRKCHIKVVGNNLYYYNNRYFEPLYYPTLTRICHEVLGEERHLFKQRHLKDFEHYAFGDKETNFQNADTDPLNYLNLINGLYDLTKNELIKHSPDIFTTTQLPFGYNPSSLCPVFEKFLKDIFLNDKVQIDFMQEAVGYCLHQSIPEPAMFYLVGEGANGKSTLLHAISNMLGKDNTTHINLGKLSKEFILVNLVNKLANLVAETPRLNLMDSDMIKAIVAGDSVIARHPHERMIQFRPYAKHFFAMNQIPRIEDMSHGMWRRIYVVYFPRIFKEHEMDRHLEKKLEGELSGIFNWALKGLERLKANNFVFTKVREMEKIKNQLRNDSNGVLSFADESLNDECPVPLKTAYEQYRNFCEEEGFRPDSKAVFRKVLMANGYSVENNTRDGNKVYVYQSQNATAA